MPVPVSELDIDTLARTLWGEARGEPLAGQIAVAHVVMNRVRRAQDRGGWWWGDDIASVCRTPWQFSCWNDHDPNRAPMEALTLADADFRRAMMVACGVAGGHEGFRDDTTCGATHYYRAGSPTPFWAEGERPVARLYNHLFFNTIA